MSAGICIMNKNGVALAADSAETVTIGGYSTIHNTAQKIIALTDSVAAVYYGNAMYMGVPIDIILGLFAKHLQGKRFFHLKEYTDEFIRFLTENTEMPLKEHEGVYYRNQLQQALDMLDNCYEEESYDCDPDDAEAADKVVHAAVMHWIEELQKDRNQYTVQARYKSLDLEFTEEDEITDEDLQYAWKLFADVAQNKDIRRWLKRDLETRTALAKAFFIVSEKLATNYLDNNSSTGICFAGYGTKDLYPGLLLMEMDGWVKGTVRYNVIEEKQISDEVSANILPLAQKDVMNNILYGFHENSLWPLQIALDDHLSELKKLFRSAEKKEQVEVLLSDISKQVIEEFQERLKIHYEHNILPPTALLAPASMAEFAESMIHLTAMLRGVEVNDASATVGGPVDVAVITKVNGFRWVKNKETEE